MWNGTLTSTSSSQKKNLFLPARAKTSLSPHAQTPLHSVPGVWGFSWRHQNGKWKSGFLIGPFVPHDLNTRFWLVRAILALYYYYYSIVTQNQFCLELKNEFLFEEISEEVFEYPSRLVLLFICDPVFSNRHTNRLFLLFVFWQYLLKTKKHPWNFLRSMKEDAVHNLLSPLLWRVTFFESFSSIVCSFCDILIEFIRHMRKDNHAPWFSYYSANREADI